MNRQTRLHDAALLRVRHLGVQFQTAQGPLHALTDVSLDVERARTLAIVGESGSGKSVLACSILRLLGPAAQTAPEAQIFFGAQDLLRLERSAMQAVRGRRIAMVFQDPMTALNPVRPIGVQLAEGLQLHLRLSRQAAQARATGLLAQVGIGSPERRMAQLPHQLSGGMRQRVVIAMAVACEPELLIADEPTTALDVTVQAEILDLLRGLQRGRQMAMILVTHDLGVAAGYADDIAVMYAGQIVEQAPTAALLRQPRMPYTRDLLRAIARLDDPPHALLHSIAGRPPVVRALAGGCRYAPRCDRRTMQCEAAQPGLESVACAEGAHWNTAAFGDGMSAYGRPGGTHAVRCWHPLEIAA
ncbi:ABC transporter ATP-binding protein [Verminephrobacter eiseniae]|uniref:ABC transporter ATP-binding protein n=1 Tax=Verminephrobacter eiseniae TaxID=364317 RepID=UPI0022370DAC|nr:ABC transporter ATP-binding protein [Verminephrobacter eiseniae]MCW5232948.1 ABC transporter ATP-binding protein [Verminephrobacter eiseniae]MCW5295496.1 ABC transporter ATP-binding protein [Verminephrobacter eiseniae]MCW8185899.1 ABC transporter ATP-binding protein [Verminephrobacter eiseniae]MCW8223733.1 ABC transporter ATP-binding protein [Verminephrobacter eiseniae]MCW8232909.1 ABC transporter ATP-binding protein [Verminephrobacter eiseniae]